MKKVIVVSKTHLDLGFTDYAESIKQKYIDSFIPSSINLANEMNTVHKKGFIWTTGSWIIKEALEHGTKEQKKALEKAIRDGNIVPHAMPFTTHTELLDEDTLDYGLSIVDKLDELRGRKTVAAKMTDVPGHTKALVPLLAKHGIKLLHIGVNGASALAEVPPCFLWKCGGAEVVVVYSGDYGGAFKCDLIDEVLYFDHTLDNHGAPSAEKIKSKLNSIAQKYPGYEVEAGSMDEFADVIWEKRNKLPVLTDEMGDTWIHGSASDPYKSASLRALMELKGKWLADGSMVRGSQEYINFTDAILCIAEHTCGMDMKKCFADYENYLKKDFQKARKADAVKMRHPFRDFPHNIIILNARLNGGYAKGSYKAIEKSWQEQRNYIDLAVSALEDRHKDEAKSLLSKLIPTEPIRATEIFDTSNEIKFGKWQFKLNEYGGISALTCNGDSVIKQNNNPLVEYRSYNEESYDFWLKHYSRNFKTTFGWCVGDFARPLLKYFKGKYPSGRFYYKTESAYTLNSDNEAKVCVNLKCDKKLCDELGAPRLIQVVYRVNDDGLTAEVSWFGKDANRLTEAIFLHMFPENGTFKMKKINEWIDYKSIISMAGRNLHAVFYSQLDKGDSKYNFVNCYSPLISPGDGKILEFDNKLEDIEKDGISYVLQDNVWGTNFPLWYEDNAYFKFEITDKELNY